MLCYPSETRGGGQGETIASYLLWKFAPLFLLLWSFRINAAIQWHNCTLLLSWIRLG